MAQIFPEDKVVDGQVIDPAPFNRTLGRYVGEMSGMMDRDNFVRGSFTTAKIVAVAGTDAALVYEATGPCNHVKAWRSTAPYTVAAGSSTVFRNVDYVGGTFDSLDSALEIVYSGNLIWDSSLTENSNKVEVVILVDGVEVVSTGPMSCMWFRNAVYLVGYTPVGAGPHTIGVAIRVYLYSATAMDSATLGFYIHEQELIVDEARR